jgi:hypothetical protein
MAKKATTARATTPEADPRFARVVKAFAGDRHVAYRTGKGFGSNALKVNEKIFAMISSKGEFVVKLPQARVEALVNAGKGAYFDPGRGRLMKEWLAVSGAATNWTALAKEAYAFVKGGS